MESNYLNRIKPLAFLTQGLTWKHLMLLIIPVGYLLTFGLYSNYGFVDYTIYSALLFFLFLVLIMVLNKPLELTFPFWVVLLVFWFGYVLKLYWYSLYLQFNFPISPEAQEVIQLFRDPMVRLQGVWILTFALAAFCITVVVILNKKEGIVRGVKDIHEPSMSAAKYEILYFGILAAIVIVSYIQYVYRIGMMSIAPRYLPFRLAGWLISIQTVLIPAMLLLLIDVAEQDLSRFRARLTIATLWAFALLQSVITGSRGSLIFLSGLVIPLWLLKKEFDKRKTLLLVTLVVVLAIAYPFLSVFRSYRAFYGLGVGQAFMKSLSPEAISPSSIITGFAFVLNRVIGMDSLIYVLSSYMRPGGWVIINAMVHGEPMGRIFTQQVVGLSEVWDFQLAPSLLGTFFMIGGIPAVILGIIFFVIFIWFLWGLIPRLFPRVYRVGWVLLIYQILNWSSEGTLEKMLLQLTVLFSSLAICEFIVK